jgi:hypothetical protein
MHLRGSMRLLPSNARVGQAAMQALRHQSGQPTSMVGTPGSKAWSITTAMGRVQEPPPGLPCWNRTGSFCQRCPFLPGPQPPGVVN